MNRVLVFCGDQYHSSIDIMGGLKAVACEGFVFEEASLGTTLLASKQCSAIVLAKLNVSSPDDLSPWATDEIADHLTGLIAGGVGLLILHAGTVGYGETKGIRNMTGGGFIRHPEACDVTLEVTGSHTESLDFESVTLKDEHYFVECDPENQVFLNSKSIHGEQPAGWLRQHGSARVCVITPGHFAEVWQNSKFQRLIRFGLKRVARG